MSYPLELTERAARVRQVFENVATYDVVEALVLEGKVVYVPNDDVLALAVKRPARPMVCRTEEPLTKDVCSGVRFSTGSHIQNDIPGVDRKSHLAPIVVYE
jgi:hypothetical protein